VEITFVSQVFAKQIEPLPNRAIISITEPDQFVTFEKEWQNCLRLYVHDIDKSLEGYKLFGKDEAKQILDFYLGLPDEVDSLIVHCLAGVSRSAGVALALSNIFELELLNSNYSCYNRHIYTTIHKAYYGDSNYYAE
jgi:predicted protein tyrosine phosphatase